MYLVAWNMSDGTVNIHRKGCTHRKPSKTPGKSGHWAQDQVEFGETDWSSQEAFAHDYWYNGIAQEWEAENPGQKYDVFQEMNFNNCVTDGENALQREEPKRRGRKPRAQKQPEPQPEPQAPASRRRKTTPAPAPEPEPAKPTRTTGYRAWATKPVPSAMVGFTQWIAREFPEFEIDPNDVIIQRIVTIASKAYGYYQASDINLERRESSAA